MNFSQFGTNSAYKRDKKYLIKPEDKKEPSILTWPLVLARLSAYSSLFLHQVKYLWLTKNTPRYFQATPQPLEHVIDLHARPRSVLLLEL